MKAGCEWSWMAEADDDGRLSDDQQASFGRHAEHCAVCAMDVREVSRLRERMEAVATPSTSDFQHHRQRQILLARAGGVQAASLRPTFAWPRLIAASALAAAVVGIGAWRLGSRRGEAVASVPRYEVTALSDASWTNDETGTTARVTLTRGSAAFHVHKLNAGQRFFVTLPDGEIEVRGTRFVVDIAGEHTRYVVVMEGKVALRQGGGGERLLLAGDRWDAPATAAERASAFAPSLVPPGAHQKAKVSAAVRASVPRRATAVAVAVDPPAVKQSAPADVAPPPVSLDAAPNLFARGMSAFRAGRYADAEALWRQFAAEHPQDPRIEDIAFLRAVVRARLGDVDGAAALARAYLERFPHGMRRKEAEALTRHASQ